MPKPKKNKNAQQKNQGAPKKEEQPQKIIE